MTSIVSLASRLGSTRTEIECCDTTLRIRVTGPGARRAANRALDRARNLEAQLDAFDPESAVRCLNETGRVRNDHVARLFRRAEGLREHTDGVFDIRRGAFEHDLKAFIRGETDSHPNHPTDRPAARIEVDGAEVSATAPVDLNGLAKGYIVDRVAQAADGLGRTAFVTAGGDMSPPPGVVGIEAPWSAEASAERTGGPAHPSAGRETGATASYLRYLDTDWAVATSGDYRRTRNGTDHLYDPAQDSVGSRHELVTVLARRDCLTADALATTLGVLPYAEALALARDWDGIEALVVTGGVIRQTQGFNDHVVAT